MFRTVSNDFSADEPFDYDMLLFFSPAGIASLKKNFPDFDQDKQNIYLGGFGPTTVKAIQDAGLRADIQAPNSEHRSMPGALGAFIESLGENA